MGENANEVAAQPITLVGVNHRLMENKAVELLTLRLYSFMNTARESESKFRQYKVARRNYKSKAYK